MLKHRWSVSKSSLKHGVRIDDADVSCAVWRGKDNTVTYVNTESKGRKELSSNEFEGENHEEADTVRVKHLQDGNTVRVKHLQDGNTVRVKHRSQNNKSEEVELCLRQRATVRY